MYNQGNILISILRKIILCIFSHIPKLQLTEKISLRILFIVLTGSYTYRFTRAGTYFFSSGCLDDETTCVLVMSGKVIVTDFSSASATVTAQTGSVSATKPVSCNPFL